jgi:hypothetical protein
MKRYWGKQKVPPGVYVRPRQLSFRSLMHEGYLPGSEQEEYRRVPALALLLAGPIVGGVFVVFLPLIGLALLIGIAIGRIVELGAHAGEAVIRVFKPTWHLGWAFLSRAKPADDQERRRDRWLDEVEKELKPQEADEDTDPRTWLD